MSVVTDSPVHSSSSDDFAALLDAELDSGSTDDAAAENELHSEEEEEEEKFDGGDEEDNVERRRKRIKLEMSESVEITDGLIPEPKELKLEASSSKVECTHPGSFAGMCMTCGKRLDEESGVALAYIHKGLRAGNDEIVRLRNSDVKNLLRHRKLYLVLDLDHTLLNSTHLAHMTPEEEYLKAQARPTQDDSEGSLFMLNFMHMMTKLRPFVHTFLKEVNQMFEMYIYTMGERPYAKEMAKLLDPRREYFHDRVISRNDGTSRHQKSLDVVLGLESAVLILDDTENAWTKHKDNLILMERYHFFASSCHQFGFQCKSMSEQQTDESESDGALAAVLSVLRKVHHLFFDELEDDLDGRDVRQALMAARKDVLKGCTIVFSRVFPTHFPADNHHLWKMAEQLGATCLIDLDPSVTHVVSTDAGTEKSRWAVKQKKFLVDPRWVEATNYLWRKQPEENFPVNQTTNQ